MQIDLHSVVTCGYNDSMETNTHKPVRIQAGEYTYRGVRISKGKTRGFCATVHTVTNWHWIGRSTLAQCIQAIDQNIANGFVVDCNKLYAPEYHARFIAPRKQNA